MNKKTIISLALTLLIGIVIVSAYTPINYKERCPISLPATEYRPQINYGNIGIYGRLSNGELTCFIPKQRTHKETITVNSPVCTPTTKEVCEDKETCKQECHWEYTCNCKCWKWTNWHWNKVCHQDCYTETICHTETTTC